MPVLPWMPAPHGLSPGKCFSWVCKETRSSSSTTDTEDHWPSAAKFRDQSSGTFRIHQWLDIGLNPQLKTPSKINWGWVHLSNLKLGLGYSWTWLLPQNVVLLVPGSLLGVSLSLVWGFRAWRWRRFFSHLTAEQQHSQWSNTRECVSKLISLHSPVCVILFTEHWCCLSRGDPSPTLCIPPPANCPW